MAKIGVFWVHDGMVFGKSVEVTVGVEGVPGLVDSPDSHAGVWEFERPWAQVSKSLGVVEYQDVPRGRVLSNRGKPLVYLDKVLMGSR